MTIYKKLVASRKKNKAGFLVLIDPEKIYSVKTNFLKSCKKYGVDALLIGGSYSKKDDIDAKVKFIKKQVKLPVIIFPSNSQQISKYADAIFFLSLISGRNPSLLIEEQVKGAPIIKRMKIEPISVGYILIKSGRVSAVSMESKTSPLPAKNINLIKAHALAGDYLGMKLIYLEAGSGAKHSIDGKIIRAVKKNISKPLIVGGGIKTAKEAAGKVKAGADFIVIGNRFEGINNEQDIIRDFAKAIKG